MCWLRLARGLPAAIEYVEKFLIKKRMLKRVKKNVTRENMDLIQEIKKEIFST